MSVSLTSVSQDATHGNVDVQSSGVCGGSDKVFLVNGTIIHIVLR